MKEILQDKDLLQRLRENNEAAFTHIYNRYWELLYGIAYKRTKDLHMTQDIVQEVFASLWKNRHTLTILNLKAYLATAIKYTTLSHLKKSGKTTLTAEELEISDHRFDSVELRNEQEYLLSLLQKEIDKLPERCKLVFIYSRMDELTTKEIADRLNISTSTVENQLNKAIKRLKLAFNRDGNAFFCFFF